MIRSLWMTMLAWVLTTACIAQDAPPELKTSFRVRYVASGSVYIEGGRDAGLTEGMKLVIKPSTQQATEGNDSGGNGPAMVAQLTVVSVARTSAVCDVASSSREIVVGDVVTLPQAEVEKLVEKRTLSNTRQYPMVVSFTEGDPLDEDVREMVPAPPLPEVNQAKGRIGFDFSTIQNVGQFHSSSTQTGMVVRADITRIYGSHWNLNGYWRGRFQSSSTPSQPSLQDLINRTYQLGLTYVNPESRWTMGAGRLYLPWASSLEVIDGGYVGFKPSEKVTVGAFGGSTPDPTAWNYDPHRQLTGSFVNTRGGSYEATAYSVTAGVGVSMLNWQVERPFVFSESTVSYKRVFSLFDSLQIDRPLSNPSAPPVPVGVGQSLLTLRIQPQRRITFNLNDTYFRDVPTYDPQLIGTGLLDKVLFQGVSGGVRVELPYHLVVYTNLGRSSTSTDSKASLNQMYGVSLSNIWRTRLQADARWSSFNSAFATGSYRSVSVSRDLGDTFRLNVQVGSEAYVSPFSKDSGSRFLNSYFDMNLGSRYFIESGFTVQRGRAQDYNQVTMTFGYRFDNRKHRKE